MIAARVQERGDRNVLLHFSVTDTGIGLTDEQQGGSSRASSKPTPPPPASTGDRPGTGDLKDLAQLMGGEVGVRARSARAALLFTVRAGIGQEHAREMMPVPDLRHRARAGGR